MEAIEKREIAKEVERAMALGKAKAYSKVSLKRPLTEHETNEYKEAMNVLR